MAAIDRRHVTVFEHVYTVGNPNIEYLLLLSGSLFDHTLNGLHAIQITGLAWLASSRSAAE